MKLVAILAYASLALNSVLIIAYGSGKVKFHVIRNNVVADFRTIQSPTTQRISDGGWMWNDRRATGLNPTPAPTVLTNGEWMNSAKTGLQPARLNGK